MNINPLQLCPQEVQTSKDHLPPPSRHKCLFISTVEPWKFAINFRTMFDSETNKAFWLQQGGLQCCLRTVIFTQVRSDSSSSDNSWKRWSTECCFRFLENLKTELSWCDWQRTLWQKLICSFNTCFLSTFFVIASRPSSTSALVSHKPMVSISFVSFTFS